MITEIENRQERSLKRNFYFVRHAQSQANVQLIGGGDPSLTILGEKQAETTGLELGQYFSLRDEQPAVLIHTGFERTRRTLEIISGILGSKLTPIEMVDFRERLLGAFEEKSLSDILQASELRGLYEKYGPSCVWFLKSEDKGVEPLSEMYTRTEKAIVFLQTEYGDSPVIVVGHAGSMKMARRIYEFGSRDDLANYLAGFVPENCEIYKLGSNK